MLEILCLILVLILIISCFKRKYNLSKVSFYAGSSVSGSWSTVSGPWSAVSGSWSAVSGS